MIMQKIFLVIFSVIFTFILFLINGGRVQKDEIHYFVICIFVICEIINIVGKVLI